MDTEIKLKETEFFFNFVRNCVTNLDPATNYFLSAFLSSLQSIEDIQNVEYASNPTYKSWHSNYVASHPQSRRISTELRNVVIHERTPNVSYRITRNFPNGLTLGAGKTTYIPFFSDNTEIELQVTTYNKERGIKRDIKIESFIAEAETELNYISKMVHECKSQFSKAV